MRSIIFIVIAGFYLTGCATVARGTHDKMVVSTQPNQALVTTDKETKNSKKARQNSPELEPIYYGCPATPCEFKVPRRSEFIMTISKEGYEDVEIGVDSGISKESLNANLAGSTGIGAVTGATVGVAVASISGATAGLGVSTGVAAAAAVALPFVVISTAADGATGALLNIRPNPIVLTLPPDGTEFKPHPKVKEIRDKRAKKRAKKEKRRAAKIKASEQD